MQLKSVVRNCTGIEDWILEKAEERRTIDPTIPPFVFPYNLGWRENISLVKIIFWYVKKKVFLHI